MSKRRKAVKSFFDYDTPETTKKLEDMGKPPSQRKVDATGTKRKTKKKKPVVATKTNGSPKTTPPVKKGVRGSTIAGAALIGSGAGLIGYTGPLVYNEMMRKKSHKVKSGDTLSQIAKKHGTTLKALLAANPQIKDANKTGTDA